MSPILQQATLWLGLQPWTIRKVCAYLWPELFKPSLLSAVHRQELTGTGYPKESEIYPTNNQMDRRASWQSDCTRNVDGLNGCHAPNAFRLAGWDFPGKADPDEDFVEYQWCHVLSFSTHLPPSSPPFILGCKLRAWYMIGKCSTSELYSQSLKKKNYPNSWFSFRPFPLGS